MARFKVVGKSIVQYGGGGLPGHLEREFRPWDQKSVIIGLGARAKPGNVTNLAIYGRQLNDHTGKLQGNDVDGSDNPSEVKVTSQGNAALDPDSSVVTGLGLRASPGNIVGLEITTIDITHGVAPATPASLGPAPDRQHFMVGEGPSEKTARLHPGNVCTGFSIRAKDGANVTNAWVEWGKILHGSEATAEGALSSVTIRTDSQRVDLILVLASGSPDGWYFNLDESLSTQMLLLTHARDALISGKRVNLAGVLWDNEQAAETEAITVFST